MQRGSLWEKMNRFLVSTATNNNGKIQPLPYFPRESQSPMALESGKPRSLGLGHLSVWFLRLWASREYTHVLGEEKEEGGTCGELITTSVPPPATSQPTAVSLCDSHYVSAKCYLLKSEAWGTDRPLIEAICTYCVHLNFKTYSLPSNHQRKGPLSPESELRVSACCLS